MTRAFTCFCLGAVSFGAITAIMDYSSPSTVYGQTNVCAGRTYILAPSMPTKTATASTNVAGGPGLPNNKGTGNASTWTGTYSATYPTSSTTIVVNCVDKLGIGGGTTVSVLGFASLYYANTYNWDTNNGACPNATGCHYSWSLNGNGNCITSGSVNAPAFSTGSTNVVGSSDFSAYLSGGPTASANVNDIGGYINDTNAPGFTWAASGNATMNPGSWPGGTFSITAASTPPVAGAAKPSFTMTDTWNVAISSGATTMGVVLPGVSSFTVGVTAYTDGDAVCIATGGGIGLAAATSTGNVTSTSTINNCAMTGIVSQP